MKNVKMSIIADADDDDDDDDDDGRITIVS